MDPGDQLLRLRALEQESRSAGVERVEDVVVVLEGRENDDLDLGERRQHLAGRRDPVEPRHADVHEDDVGAEPADLVDCKPAVTSLADHLDRLVARQHRPEAGPHEVVIVDEHDPDRAAHAGTSPRYGRRARTRKTPFADSVSIRPPTSDARSRIPTMPWPAGPTPFATGFVTPISSASGP